MPYNRATFPSFPDAEAFVALYKNVTSDTILEVKRKLAAADTEYDYSFLNTSNLISLEQLQYAIHRSLVNRDNGTMKAKTLNAEIIYNLSPVNNIMEAFKKFGVDEKIPNVVVVKVFKTEDKVSFEQVSSSLSNILDGSESVQLTDEVFLETVDMAKLKKTYKLNTVKFTTENIQGQLTRLAIGSCIIRGV